MHLGRPLGVRSWFRRSPVPIAVCASVALLAVACGGGNNASPTPSPAPTPALAAASPLPSPSRPPLTQPIPGASPSAAVTATTSAPSGPGQSYTVQSGDTLATIANQFYNDPTAWQPIFDANKDVIGSNPDNLQVGEKLTIPPKQ